MFKKITILLILTFTFQFSFALDNKSKFSQYNYHEICSDLQDNIVKPGKKLSNKEKSILKKYLSSKDVSKLSKKDLRYFESALKKHRFFIANKKSKSKNNLLVWPGHSEKSKWFKVKKDLAPGTYYMLSIDLLSGKLKAKQRLSNIERKLIKNFLDVADVKNMRARDVKFFENAIKKHKFVTVNKSNNKRFLRSWPQKTDTGDWYRYNKTNNGGKKRILPGNEGGKKKFYLNQILGKIKKEIELNKIL